MTSADMDAGSLAPMGPSKMLGDSDWDDEDLLTIGEASERLADEVKRSRERVRLLQGLLDDCGELNVESRDLRAQIDAETKRAEDLAAAAERIRAGQANAPVPK